MAKKNDPRKLRPNPEVGEILRVIEKNWKEFVTEGDYTRRRGKARVLCALLEQMIDEPEYLPADLHEGTVPDDRYWFQEKDFPEHAARFLNESPFDTPGPAENSCFFYTDTAMFSPLYSGPPIDPCVRPLVNHGPYVHAFEKRHATDTETTRHVISGEVLKRLVGKRRLPRAKDGDETHVLFCDPKGCRGKLIYQGFIVGKTGNLQKAVAAASQVSRDMKIRLVVATKRISFCTR